MSTGKRIDFILCLCKRVPIISCLLTCIQERQSEEFMNCVLINVLYVKLFILITKFGGGISMTENMCLPLECNRHGCNNCLLDAVAMTTALYH